MKKVLVSTKLTESQKRQLESISKELVFTYGSEDKEANILIGSFAPSVMKDFKNLELYLSAAVGVDAFIKKGILPEKTILCNAVDVHSQEVAEHMVSTLVMLVKKLHLYKNNQANHLWKDEGTVKAFSEMKVLILGLGNIGKATAKLCKGLGMYVIGMKRNINCKVDDVDEIRSIDDLDEVLPKVDAVLSVLPGTEQTYHLMTLDRFKLMKKDAYFINDGRGSLVEEDVLKEVLEDKVIDSIAQDVFEKEPIDKNNNLWDFDNLLITPHIAGYFHLDLARQKYVDLCEENLRRFINNEELLNVVEERE